MDLSARDVHEKQFHDAWRGYNQEEVDDFLDKVAEVLEALRRENESLRSRISDLDQVLSTSRDTEAMLKKTLISAQKAAEEALNNAKARAEQLITEADQRVKSANEQARERVRAAEEEARQRVATAEEEARRKSEHAEREHAEKTRVLDSSIEELSAYEADLKKRLRAFLEEEAKTLETLTENEPPAQAKAEVRQGQQPRPVERLHAAPSTIHRDLEGPRIAPRSQVEQIGPRADAGDDLVDPIVRRRRPEEPNNRRGLRGFFWGGDQG
jgi:cell division initiation protein